MTQNHELAQKLKSCGIRVTGQRLLVLKVLSNRRRHLSVEEIQGDLSREFGAVSRASVYNILKSLVDARLVRELTLLSSKALYEFVHDDHLHFVCDKCKKVTDIECESVPNVELPVKWKRRMRELDVIVRGLCPSCEKS